MARPQHEDMPLVEPAAALEGTYSTWLTLLHTVDLGANNWDLIAVDNLGNMYIQCLAPNISRIYTVAGIMAYTENNLLWVPNGDLHRRSWSALVRYIVGFRLIVGAPYRVFRDGGLIFSRNPGLDIANWEFTTGACPSPDGHYVGLVGSHAVTHTSRLLALYEGV